MIMRQIDNPELFFSATSALKSTTKKQLQVVDGALQVVSNRVLVNYKIEHDRPVGTYTAERNGKTVILMTPISTDTTNISTDTDVAGAAWISDSMRYGASIPELQECVYKLTGEAYPKTQLLGTVHALCKGKHLTILCNTVDKRIIILSDRLTLVLLPPSVRADTCKKLVTAIPRVVFDSLNDQVQSANIIITTLLQQWYEDQSKPE